MLYDRLPSWRFACLMALCLALLCLLCMIARGCIGSLSTAAVDDHLGAVCASSIGPRLQLCLRIATRKPVLTLDDVLSKAARSGVYSHHSMRVESSNPLLLPFRGNMRYFMRLC